jgi:hypothetical protein
MHVVDVGKYLIQNVIWGVMSGHAIYDFESILSKRNTDGVETMDNYNRTVWTQQHIPVAYSISSNVLGFEDSILHRERVII